MTVYTPGQIDYDLSDWSYGIGGWSAAKPISVTTSNKPVLSSTGTLGVTTATEPTAGNERYYFERFEGSDGEISTTAIGANLQDGYPGNIQDGLIARVQPYNDGSGKYSAVVVSRNITFFQPIWNLGIWEFDGSTLTLPIVDNVQIVNGRNYQNPQILAVERTVVGPVNTNIYYVDNPFSIMQGWKFLLSTGCKDATFNLSGGSYTVTAITLGARQNAYGATCAISVAGVPTSTVVALKPEIGAVACIPASGIGSSPGLETHLKLRVIDTVAKLKTWGAHEPEPPWTDNYSVSTLDFSSATPKIPESGTWGIICNHLVTPGTLSYENVNFTRL